MPKADPFVTHVTRCAKQGPSKEIAAALGALVKARLKARQRRPEPAQSRRAMPPPSPARQRRGARRVGLKSYTPTGKPNYTRRYTWTHHMIDTIVAHTNTRDATRANETCDNPAYAAKRLDFNWAADNGYITWA